MLSRSGYAFQFPPHVALERSTLLAESATRLRQVARDARVRGAQACGWQGAPRPQARCACRLVCVARPCHAGSCSHSVGNTLTSKPHVALLLSILDAACRARFAMGAQLQARLWRAADTGVVVCRQWSVRAPEHEVAAARPRHRHQRRCVCPPAYLHMLSRTVVTLWIAAGARQFLLPRFTLLGMRSADATMFLQFVMTWPSC